MPKLQKKHSSSKKTRVVKKRTFLRSQKKTFSFSWPKAIFVIGALFLAISILYHIEQLINLSFYHQHLPAVQTNRTSRPVEVSIDKVDIDLPILETVIANNTWQIADDGISHLAQSARPGENGTIILYGHNTNDRFGPIRWLDKGDVVTITTADTKVYHFVVKQIVTVDPSDTKILTSQKGSTLILYTCTGFADLQRYVLIAKPQ